MIYILTDISASGGTETWMKNLCLALNILNIEFAIIREYFTDFKDGSTLIINNYLHKIFPKLFQTLKIYFVMHGQSNPINSYLIDNLEYFNGVICVSDQIKQSVCEHNLLKHLNFFVLENFVEPVKVIEQIEQIKPTNLTVFNFVGRVSPEKNLPMLLYAFGGLDTNDWFLNIWGDTSNTRHYELLTKIINKLGISNKVKFCGFTNDKNMLYANCTYTILPSVVEGSSYSVLESLAHGIPVIASKSVGDNNYQITDGKNGYLIDIGIISGTNLANQNFNNELLSVGYFEGVIHRNYKNNIITLNRNILPLPPTTFNIKSPKFDSNVNNIIKVLNLAINNKIIILPQTNISKELYFKTIKDICV